MIVQLLEEFEETESVIGTVITMLIPPQILATMGINVAEDPNVSISERR